jgi:hypothetical protein
VPVEMASSTQQGGGVSWTESGWPRRVGWLVPVGTTYFVSGKLGLPLAVYHPGATLVWAPSGIALAACLILGTWVWPAIFVAAFAVILTTAGLVWTALAIGLGNSLEPLRRRENTERGEPAGRAPSRRRAGWRPRPGDPSGTARVR